ncbi:unnamed protein product [Rotaria sordida]|uniref:Uncharacterized protein n=1 Tax=Rotaria sordida TaxID=392033 RepID=A0A813YLM4_9BILA|nr:unnamed protein product [Rotaria sordida]
MRVNKELSQNGYRSHHERKYDDRLRRRNYHHDDHQSHRNGNYSSHTSLKSQHYQHHRHENYRSSHSSSPSLNRKDNNQSNYDDNHPSSSRFDRPTNSPDIYSPLSIDQPIISDRLHPTVLYNKSSSSMPDRGLPSHYINSERNRYSPSPLSSLAYRRDNSYPSPSLSSYRNDYIPRNNNNNNNNNNDLYIRNEHRSPTPSVLAPLSTRSTVDTYNDVYRQNDSNNRSQHYDIGSNPNGSSRAYHPMTSTPSSNHHSDSYRISSTTRMSSPSSLPTLSASSSSSSAYIIYDQSTQPFSSRREIDYQTRDYGLTTSMDYRQIVSNKSSDRYDNDYCSSSFRDRSNLKRSRSNFNENESKRRMRR